MLALQDRLNYTDGTTGISTHYHTTGSRYTGLNTKETAKEIRKHLKIRFPEVKFSIRTEYNAIRLHIVKSPYNYSKLEYKQDLIPADYREYEEQNNIELIAIKDYCQKLLDSYNYNNSDLMTDYYNVHFYTTCDIYYKHEQLEQSTADKQAIKEYREHIINEQIKADKQSDLDYIEYQKQQEIRKVENKERLFVKNENIEYINNHIKVDDLATAMQYKEHDIKWANLNKNNSLAEYKEEIEKCDYTKQDILITRNIYFDTYNALKLFKNMFLTDFDFLNNSGGSATDDPRIKNENDYNNMSKEQRLFIDIYRIGICVIYDGIQQFFIDTQGYNYARYIGIE